MRSKEDIRQEIHNLWKLHNEACQRRNKDMRLACIAKINALTWVLEGDSDVQNMLH